jgi:hypothetical protein
LTINPTAASTINNTSIGATTASTGRFTSVTATTGSVVIGTSGQGIDFSATSGTGTSELLNDYEEGTWTPTYTAFTGTFTTEASYTKVGNLVTLRWTQLTGTFSCNPATSNIQGLPYLPAGTEQKAVATSSVSDTVTFASCTLYKLSGGAGSIYLGALTSVGNQGFSITYFT